MSTEKRVFSKLFKSKKINLSLIGDYESELGSLKLLDLEHDAKLRNFNELADDLYGLLVRFELDYEELQDRQEQIETQSSSLSDTMQLVEEKAEELGAAPFEFMPDYQEAINLLDKTYENYAQYSSNAEYLIKEKLHFQ